MSEPIEPMDSFIFYVLMWFHLCLCVLSIARRRSLIFLNGSLYSA